MTACSTRLPSRELIADSVEYMVNAHCADAMVCISNCDKITPGMLMAALRLNIPAVFVSGGPMEAGKVVLDGKRKALDLVDAMVAAADDSVSDADVADHRALGLPDLRLVLGHVHRQLDELPDRGAGPLAARQRLDARDPRRPQAPVRGGRPPDRRPRAPLLRAGRRHRAAARHRLARRLRERHDARHRHGRLDQHGAAHPGRRPRGRDRLHHGRHRPAVAPGAGALQGRAGQVPTCTWRTCTAPAASWRSSASSTAPACSTRDLPTVHAPTLGEALDRWDIARTNSESVRDFYRAAPGRRADADRLQPGPPLGRARPRPRRRA